MQEGGGKAGGVQTNYENYGVHFYAVAEKSRTAIPCLDVRYWLMPNFHWTRYRSAGNQKWVNSRVRST